VAAGQAQYAACAACHGQNGEGNPMLNAPKIAGQQAWYIERQLNHFKQGARGGEGDTNGAQMTAFANMLTTDEAVRNIAAYIATFPDTPAQTTIAGDIANGYDIYDRNCAACHLDNGAGTWYTDAPKLAGMSDWYFVTQISNFRAGIRGNHPADAYGEQMVQMATAMGDLEEINDVAAYINTLR
jgi:cytochrome c oxidase subunit 2